MAHHTDDPDTVCPSCVDRVTHAHLVVGATTGGHHRVTVYRRRPVCSDDWMVEWHHRYPTSDESLARLLEAASPVDLIVTQPMETAP